LLGYVVRTDGEMAVKRLQGGTLRGRKERRRPRLKWMNVVERELRSRGV
jgi:hypothetical protein